MISTRYPAACILILMACAGCSKQPASIAVPPKLTFGDRQLQQMLDDRPEMRAAIPPAHPVFSRVVDGFNGKEAGMRVYWNANGPAGVDTANYSPPYEHYPACISISDSKKLTAIDRWAYAVTELCLAANVKEIDRLFQEAVDGKLKAEDYAAQCVELEFKALANAQRFFRKNPLDVGPYGQDKYYKWLTYDLGTLERYRSSFRVTGLPAVGNHYEGFKEYYETSITPYAEALRKSKP